MPRAKVLHPPTLCPLSMLGSIVSMFVSPRGPAFALKKFEVLYVRRAKTVVVYEASAPHFLQVLGHIAVLVFTDQCLVGTDPWLAPRQDGVLTFHTGLPCVLIVHPIQDAPNLR